MTELHNNTSIYFAHKNELTLHIRVSKKCNADCSYCSSFETKAANLMDLKDLKKSINFLKKQILKNNIGGEREHIFVQYIGGELLTVPTSYLQDFTQIVKDILSPIFKNYHHGGQTNLISNSKKINDLMQIFDNRIGTSFDSQTQQRTINKDSKKYQTIFMKNISFVKKQYGINLPGIVVLDKKMSLNIHNEIELANKRLSHITIRPVFQGGSLIDKLSISEMESIYLEIFDKWFLKQNIIIEPFYNYLKKRISHIEQTSNSYYSGCPSQHNCSLTSLNLEPDGSIYVCQDMADSKSYKLGNAIEEEWNNDFFDLLTQRSYKLKSECYSCDYFKDCQGGCMNEAIEQTEEGLYGKTLYCSIWKKLFKKIDEAIASNDLYLIKKWLSRFDLH